jgi:ABC-type transport system substrate-binding protein
MRPWLLAFMLALASSVMGIAQTVEESFARDPGPLDFIRGEGYEQAIIQSLSGDALVGLDAQNSVVPRLSDTWQIKGNHIRFHLREGLRFLNGAPVKPEDIAWTFQEIQTSQDASSTKRGILRGVKVMLIGSLVDLSSAKPPARLLMELAHVPIARKGNPEEGSGPFTLVRKGSEWTFTARAHFLKPKITTFHFRLIADDQALLQNLQKGWLSIGVPPARNGLRPPLNMVELHQPTNAQLIVFSRLGVAPLQALERWRSEAFPVAFFGAKAHSSRGLWPESLGFPVMNIQAPAPSSPKGQYWELLYSSGDELVQKALLALKERAKRDGVDLEPKPMEAALLYQRLQQGDFQLASALNIFDPHPWSVLELLEPSGPMNFCGWKDAAFAGLATRLDSPQSPAWRELQNIWAAQPAALPLLDFTSVVWVDKRLQVVPSALGLYLTTPGPSAWTWTK